MTHLVNHNLRPELRSDNTLHVIGVISNPQQYHSRYRLGREWIEAMRSTPNVKLHIVETAFGDRHHEVDSDLKLRNQSSIWIKESMINLGIRHRLPHDWKYAAWIDMDVFFRDPHWAQKTMHELQHFGIVQPWQNCVDLGPNGSILKTHQSFGSLHQSGVRKQRNQFEPYAYGHTGYAWACSRAFYEAVNGLLDFCILGSADHHMAWACVGDSNATIHRKMTASYFRKIHEWELKAIRITHGQVGYVPGRIEHSWHGSKVNRKYRERWQILIDNAYDPDHDLMYDPQGLIKLIGKPALEHAIHQYTVDRREDSIDV